MAAHGRLDILFNNAGVSFPGKVEDITVDIWGTRAWRSCQGGFPGHPYGDSGHAQRWWRVDHQYVLGHGPCRQSHLAGLFGCQGRHHDLYQVGGPAICEGGYPPIQCALAMRAAWIWERGMPGSEGLDRSIASRRFSPASPSRAYDRACKLQRRQRVRTLCPSYGGVRLARVGLVADCRFCLIQDGAAGSADRHQSDTAVVVVRCD